MKTRATPGRTETLTAPSVAPIMAVTVACFGCWPQPLSSNASTTNRSSKPILGETVLQQLRAPFLALGDFEADFEQGIGAEIKFDGKMYVSSSGLRLDYIAKNRRVLRTIIVSDGVTVDVDNLHRTIWRTISPCGPAILFPFVAYRGHTGSSSDRTPSRVIRGVDYAVLTSQGRAIFAQRTGMELVMETEDERWIRMYNPRSKALQDSWFVVGGHVPELFTSTQTAEFPVSPYCSP